MARVGWFETSADEPERLVRFFQDVFGWKIEKYEGAEDYYLVTTGSNTEYGTDGAIMRRRGPQPVVNTVLVEDLDAAIEKVTAAGGSVAVPKMEVANQGNLAYCLDTEGTLFGMMQPFPM